MFDADATRSIGVPVLEAMRRSGRVPGTGASATPAAAPSKTQTINIGGNSVTVQGNADAAVLSQINRLLETNNKAMIQYFKDSWRTEG